MLLLLADGLEPADAAALRTHLASGCPRCSAYLAEADATLTYLPYALESKSPSAAAREKLFERISASLVAAPRMPVSSGRRRTLKMSPWIRRTIPVAVAACLTFIATVQVMRSVHRSREQHVSDTINNLTRQVSASEQQVRALQGQNKVANSTLDALYSSPRLITLQGISQPKAFGRAMWNEARGAWHFRAFNLEPLPPKDAYELWFVTPYGRKVPAATFKPDEHGNAYLVVTLPKDVGPVNAAEVTDEPAVGTFQPTGALQLRGRME